MIRRMAEDDLLTYEDCIARGDRAARRAETQMIGEHVAEAQFHATMAVFWNLRARAAPPGRTLAEHFAEWRTAHPAS